MKILNKLKLSKVKEYRSVDGVLKCITSLDRVMREFDVMKHLFHRNIMLLFEVIDDDDHDKVSATNAYICDFMMLIC